MMIDEQQPVISFDASDRCDACGAQAYTLARSDKGELLFCAHHRRVNAESLLDEGWELVDDIVGIENDLAYDLDTHSTL